VLSGIGVVVPILFAATASGLSWRLAFLVAAVFPLAGWLALRPLDAE